MKEQTEKYTKNSCEMIKKLEELKSQNRELKQNKIDSVNDTKYKAIKIHTEELNDINTECNNYKSKIQHQADQINQQNIEF